MSDIFRITDRFKITGRGIIYTIGNDKDTIIRLGDILYDLHGSQFKVKGIEMIRKRSDAIHITNAPIGLFFESISGAEVGGKDSGQRSDSHKFPVLQSPFIPT